jgi:hypothetical protein
LEVVHASHGFSHALSLVAGPAWWALHFGHLHLAQSFRFGPVKSLCFAVVVVCFLRGTFVTYLKEGVLYLAWVSENQQNWLFCLGKQGVGERLAYAGVCS